MGQTDDTTQRRVLKMLVALITMTVLLSVCYNAYSLYLPQILESCVAHSHNFDPQDQHIVSVAARYKSYLDSLTSLMFLLLAPIIGSISDVYGRKPVLLFLALCNALSAGFMLVGYMYLWLWCLIVSKILSFALMGAFSITFAYVTDISTNENKAKHFGYIMGSFGVGMIIAPFGLSELGKLSLLYPQILAVGAYVLAGIIGLIFLKESLNYDIETDTYLISTKRMPKLTTLLNLWRAIKPVMYADTYKEQRTFVLWLAIMYCFYYIGESDLSTTLVLYVSYRYGWNDVKISILMTVQGILLLFSQIILLPFITKKLGTRLGAQLALCAAGIGHAMVAFAYNPWILYTALVPCSGFAPMTYTFLKTNVSNNTKKGEQGAALGALFSISSAAQIVGALIAENVFSYFISPHAIIYMPGMQFIIGSFIFVCLLVCCTIVFILHPEKNGVVLGGPEEVEDGANERTRLIN